MKVIYVLYIFIVCAFGEEKFYDRRYDYYDVEYFVQSPRLLKKYLDCFLSKGPCTPLGRAFKAILPEAVSTACAKCSPSQRRFTRRAFEAFKTFFPDSHEEFKKKLDPKGKYFVNFEAAISS